MRSTWAVHSRARRLIASLFGILVWNLVSFAQSPNADRLGDPLPEGAIARLGSARLRHEGRDENRGMSVFSPDGKLLATITPSADTFIWDVRTGRKVGTIHVSQTKSDLAAFSADSQSIAVASAGQISISPTSGDHHFKYPRSVGDNPRRIDWLEFLPDRSVVFIENRGDICVVDRNGAEKFRIAHGATQPLAGLDGDGKTLTIWNQENVDRWDLSKRAKIATVKFPYLSSFAKLRLRTDGSLFATHLNAGGVVFWDPATQKETGRLEDGKLQVDAGMEFSPDGKRLVTVTRRGSDAMVKHWDVATGKLLKAFSIPIDDAGDPAVSPDGKAVAFTTARPAIPLWDLQTGKRVFDRGGLDETPISLSFAPGGRLIAAGGRQICTWDVVTSKLVNSVSLPFPCTGLAVDPSGDWGVAVGKGNINPRICSFKTGAIEAELRPPPNTSITAGTPVFSTDGARLHALAMADNSSDPIRLTWEIRTRKLLPVQQDPKAPYFRAFVEQYLLRMKVNLQIDWPTGDPSEIAVHNADDNRLLLKVAPAGDPSWAASNGALLAIGSRTSTMQFFGSYPAAHEVWEIASGERVWPPASVTPKKDTHFSIVDISCDGRTLAVVNGHSSITLLDTIEGKEIETKDLPSGRQDYVRCLAFSPDGRRLASGQSDGTILIWDVARVTRRGMTPRSLSASEVEKLWGDLARDARTARQAIDRLAADPESSLKLCRERLKPAPPLAASRIDKLVADLDAPKFAVRQSASRELAKIRFEVDAQLRSALATATSPEVKRRLKMLIELPIPPRSPESLQMLRAIELLARIENPEAHEILRKLASGDPLAWETEFATQSLKRAVIRK